MKGLIPDPALAPIAAARAAERERVEYLDAFRRDLARVEGDPHQRAVDGTLARVRADLCASFGLSGADGRAR